MRLTPALCGLLALLAAPALFADDSDAWVVGGGQSRVVDSWPSESNKIFVSEHPLNGGIRLCAVTISPRTPGPSRYLSIQHFQGQNGFTFVAHQEDWFFLRGTVVQLLAVFDRKNAVSLIGTGFGSDIKLGSDFSDTPKLNTLLSESGSLDIEFPGKPGLTWRVDLKRVSTGMAKLRSCAAKPPAT